MGFESELHSFEYRPNHPFGRAKLKINFKSVCGIQEIHLRRATVLIKNFFRLLVRAMNRLRTKKKKT